MHIAVLNRLRNRQSHSSGQARLQTPMRRVGHVSNVLGRREGRERGSAGTHVDISIGRELGHGAHTLTIGAFSRFGVIGPAQPAAVYCSEGSVWIIFIGSAKDVNRREEKFQIRFLQIEDIEVQRRIGDHEAPVFPNPEDEKRRQRVVIHTTQAAGKETAAHDIILIDTHDTPLFAKHIANAWMSYKVFANAKVGRLNSCSNASLAHAYMAEISQDLRETRPSDLATYAEIFDEFAAEVRCDLNLKEAVFRHREIIVQTLVILNSMLRAPTGLEREVAQRAKYVLASSGTSQPASPIKSPNAKTAFSFESVTSSTAELNSRIDSIIQDRLYLIRSGFNLLISLFLCSESISSRSNILSGPPPLDINSWFDLLTPDLYTLLEEKFKCKPKHSEVSEGMAEFNKSLALARTRLMVSNDNPASEQKNVASSSLTDSILTPLRKNKMKAAAASQKLEPQLSFVRESIADQQLILMMEVCRVGSMDFRQLTPGMSRVEMHYGSQSAMAPIGDTFTRQDNWEITLENTVGRLSGILDDLLMFERSEHRNGGTGGLSSALNAPSQAKPRRRGEDSKEEVATKKVVLPPSPRKGDSPRKAPAVTSREMKHGPLETQEILLFCTTQVLRMLAWDSSRVREVLASDLRPLFLPILSVLNVIVPRGFVKPGATVEYGSDPSDSVAQPKHGFFNCFQAKGEAATATRTNPLQARQPPEELFPRIPVNAYGPSQLSGLSKSSWLLLVLSRRALEETLNTLYLQKDPAFVSASQVVARNGGGSAYVLEVSPRIHREKSSATETNASEQATDQPSQISQRKPVLSIVTDVVDEDEDDEDAENVAFLQRERQGRGQRDIYDDKSPSQSSFYGEKAPLLEPKRSATPLTVKRL